MSGWIRRAGEADGADTTDSGDSIEYRAQASSAQSGNAPERSQDRAAVSNGGLNGAPKGPKRALTQSQRDELIAEVLGDVATLSDRMSLIHGQIQALESALTANDFVRWRNTIDMKLSELAQVNLSQQAAQRLESFAQAYMAQLSKEANNLVVIAAKKAVADTMTFNLLFDKLHREWILRLASVAAVAFVATLVANFVSRIL